MRAFIEYPGSARAFGQLPENWRRPRRAEPVPWTPRQFAGFSWSSSAVDPSGGEPTRSWVGQSLPASLEVPQFASSEPSGQNTWPSQTALLSMMAAPSLQTKTSSGVRPIQAATQVR